METSLGRGYSLNEESGITDFYSPPSSIVDEDEEQDDDLFYPENEEAEDEEEKDHLSDIPTSNTILSSSSMDEISNMNFSAFKPLSFKLMPMEAATPPSTPLIPRRLLDPLTSATAAFQNMTINTNLPRTPLRNPDVTTTNWSLGTSTTEFRNNNSLFPRPGDHTPKTATTTNLLTPTSIDRYLAGQRRLSDSTYQSSRTLDLPLALSSTTTNRHQSIAVQHTEVTNETSRLYSYMASVDGLPSNIRTPYVSSSSNSWSNFDDTLSPQPRMNNNPYSPQPRMNNNPYSPQLNLKPVQSPCLTHSPYPQRVNPFTPSSPYHPQQQSQPIMNQFQSHDTWFLSEMSAMLHQNQQQQQQSMGMLNTNISLSTTAQQILAGNAMNNRPLRSEKIDTEVIQHLIREAKWKRECGMKKEVCVFCRNNGENELIFSSHSLKDSVGNVTCPILRSYQCPICGATGAQAHTIKYCQATGNDNNRHVPTPYEKMIHMQTFGFDDNMLASLPSVFGQMTTSPSSLYTNGWSNSYL